MLKYRLGMVCCILLLLAALSGMAYAQTYQPIPSSIIASGVADTSGPAGFAYIEYWVWDGGNGYYYYTYKIYNSAFQPFIKHLTIGNPTGEPYVVTGSSGGGPLGSTPWSYASHASLPTLVDWVASDPNTVIYAGQSSWDSQFFQFASKLPPSSAPLAVREGSLTSYANGLIPAPGGATSPKSSGYWKHQYSGKGNRTEAGSLPRYMDNIATYSQVFKGNLAGTVTQDLAFGMATLEVADNSDMLGKAKKELFALWLNIVSQKVNYYAPVKLDPAVAVTNAATVGAVVQEVEGVILSSASTDEDLERAKDMAEVLNLQ